MRTSIAVPTGTRTLLMFTPCLANDLPSVLEWNCTHGAAPTDTYDGSTNTGSSFLTYDLTSAPYSSAQIGVPTAANNLVSGRIISCGVKLRNTSAPMARCGEICYGESTEHSSLAHTTTTSFDGVRLQIEGLATTVWANQVDHSTLTHTISPHLDAETLYPRESTATGFPNNYKYPFSPSGLKFSPGGSSSEGAPIFGMVIYNPSDVTQSYSLEYVMHSEYIGDPVIGNTTRVYPDEEFGHLMHTAVQMHKEDAPGKPIQHQMKGVLGHVEQELKRDASKGASNFMKRQVIPGLEKGATTALLGLLL